MHWFTCKMKDLHLNMNELGSKFPLESGDKALFGRGSGLNSDDHTVSLRHVSFQLNESDSETPRVSFQVIGTNPIWVLKNSDKTLNLFKKFDKGQSELGDRFYLSGKSPIWFKLNKAQVSEPEIEFQQLDISQIDPVKEFGFLVMRHEFDRYPKGMFQNVEDWKWFLDEPSKESEDDDEDDFEGMRKKRGKRKVFKDNEDDESTGDRLIVKMIKTLLLRLVVFNKQNPSYIRTSTRSANTSTTSVKKLISPTRSYTRGFAD